MTDEEASPQEVAAFMLEELDRRGVLYQSHIVQDIITEFGEEFTYINKSGGWSIRKDVLTAFTALTPDVVWDRGGRYWERRQSFDHRGRARE